MEQGSGPPGELAGTGEMSQRNNPQPHTGLQTSSRKGSGPKGRGLDGPTFKLRPTLLGRQDAATVCVRCAVLGTGSGLLRSFLEAPLPAAGSACRSWGQ